MKGKPDAEWPSQRQDYVKITSNERVLGKDGLEIKSGKDGVKYEIKKAKRFFDRVSKYF